jgi:hypothetical protein
VLVGLAEAKMPWFWQSAALIALALVVANLLVVVAVYAHVAVQAAHRRRDARIRARVDALLAHPDPRHLHDAVARFDRAERQVAAFMLIDRLDHAGDEESAQLRAAIR